MLSFLDNDGHLVGHSTEAALREISTPEVLHSFQLECTAFVEGHLDSDDLDTEVVSTVHAIRVAIAERWARAGASTLEQNLAKTLDRQLSPYREALLMHPDSETNSEWLEILWTEGTDIDINAWWGFQMLDDPELNLDITQILKTIQAEALMPPLPPRHEHAWEAPPPGFSLRPWPYHQDWFPPSCHDVRRDRFEANFDMYADFADDYDPGQCILR